MTSGVFDAAKDPKDRPIFVLRAVLQLFFSSRNKRGPLIITAGVPPFLSRFFAIVRPLREIYMPRSKKLLLASGGLVFFRVSIFIHYRKNIYITYSTNLYSAKKKKKRIVIYGVDRIFTRDHAPARENCQFSIF